MHRLIALIALLACAAPVAAAVHHRLDVSLDPQAGRLAVRDTISFERRSGAVEFVLHAGLEPRLNGRALEPVARIAGAVPLERYRLPADDAVLVLEYGGRIRHTLTERAEGVGRSQGLSVGTIDADGVILSGATGWYPRFVHDELVSFELEVRVPAGWQAVSQGALSTAGPERFGWREAQPQDEIYLLAAAFTRYERETAQATAMVFLRRPDPALAERYLALTGDYLKLFSGLMGDYPYAKFALVENFWETGYGMPSFTLLGPRVLRLPFIPFTSYPHEIVHNWWGNGVYLDAHGGNWSEGLTAYMADHLLKERAGQGAEYRRDQLQHYAEHVSVARDFPLSEFRGRHSGASQAIGYGKGAMLFHMLRLQLGDAVFVGGLRRFYREQRFRFAGFSELRGAFEAASGRDLGGFFEQWLRRRGAPRLELAAVDFGPRSARFTLHQRQSEVPYRLDVPVSVRLADGRLEQRTLTLTEPSRPFSLAFSQAPVCLAVDPRFDLFRQLLPGERPLSLDALLGAERLLLVLPERAPAPLLAAYRELARGWAAGGPVQLSTDVELKQLPQDRPVLLLGWENRFRPELAAALGPRARLEEAAVEIGNERLPRTGHSFVLTAARNGAAPLAWLAADSAVPVAGLARKVPHYGKYGYLAFAGDAPDNRLKGQWPVSGSPLVHAIGEAECMPPPRAPLARLAEPAD